MAEIDILLQGLVEADGHAAACNRLLELPDMEQYLFGLAFVRSAGVSQISSNLESNSHKLEVFIGIRNGITSVQSVFAFLRLGIRPYAVDTATNAKIFHPKIYLAYNKKTAHVILGSANLTSGGLGRNIEASTTIKLDRTIPADDNYVAKIVQVLSNMPTAYPNHVFRIDSPKLAVRLLQEGRLEDERIARFPLTGRSRLGRQPDRLPPIPTHSKLLPKSRKGAKRGKVTQITGAAELVWESKPLTERSLNIPAGGNTNITGDTNLGRGIMEDIEFQHYFRDAVFSDLVWVKDPTSNAPDLERGRINAELVIKNVFLGIFDLEITHDPRTNTKSYGQHNAMTKIKWGPAKPLIARPDLLGRSLKLYKKGKADFIILID